MLFSTLMVQGLLKGNKTQTRRIINVKVNDLEVGVPLSLSAIQKVNVGDIIWVRETSFTMNIDDEIDGRTIEVAYKASIDEAEQKYGHITNARGKRFIDGWKWKPSIFMRKSACRLFLKVTGVRVERLQDISEDDAKKEGVETSFASDSIHYEHESFKNYTWHGDGGDDSFSGFSDTKSAKDSFQSLWYKINNKASWEENPFVWVYEFEVLRERPEGFM